MKKKAFLMNGKRLLSFVLAVLMVCTLIPATDVTKVYAAEGDTSTEPVIQGNGTKDDPYQIGTADQLYWFAALLDGRDGITQNLNANAVLIADITVNEGVLDADGNLVSDTSGFVTWTPPCKDAGRSDKAYQGTFDGKGHTIRGLYAPDTTAKCAFIGSCDGTIRNLGITDSFFGSSKTRQTGTFVGYGYPKCVIENCFSTSVVEGDEECGGIAAKNNGTTKGCYFAGKISVNNYYSDAITTYGTKENCYYLDTCGFKSVNSENDDRAKTAEQFASGEVCYLLNNGVTDGTQAWYQMIDNENPDAFPKYEGLTIGYDEANQRYFGYCSGEHVWVKEKDIDPTCTEGGYIVYKCSKCGGTKTEPDNGKPALGHSCTEDGRCTRCGSFQALQPKNGDGTAEDPYQLVNYSNLVWFGQQVDSGALYINAILAADITANENLLDADGNVKGTPEYTWTPICNKSEFYQGTFDGKGHTISGLYAPDTSESKKCGFIGLCNGTIKNLGITDSFFGGSGIFVGTFVGNGRGECVIENCFSSAVVQAAYLCGGIAGMTYGTIRNCYFAGKISVEDTSHNNENAIANDNNNHGTLENCYYLDTCGLTSERAKAKTAEQFASGQVAFLLQDGQTDTVWGQNLAEGESRQNYPVPDGKFRVYYNEIYTGCEGKPGDVTYAYSNDDLSHVYAEHTDADNDGRCDICSNFMDGIGAGLAGYSLILDGSVGVNFYMELSDAVLADDTAYMEFTLPSGEVSKVPLDKNNSEVISDKTYYKFKCQVNAAGMTDTIKAQLKSNAGNSKVYEYTVKEYSDYLFANKENNVEFAKAYDLIKAMVNYGSYAQIYADYHTDRLAVGDKSDLTSVEDVTIGEEYKYTISGESVNANVTFAGASLTLLSTTTLRMYFKLTDVDADNVTFTYHGIDFDKTKSGDYYYVDIVGIPADKLDDDCEVRVTVDNNTTFEVTYNPMAYCYNVINRETTETRTDALKNLIKAMVIYNQAADAYVATIRR